MKKTYITLTFLAFLLAFLSIMYFINIPAPSKAVVETYNLKVK